mmetsp:Transcript_17354/g.20818  ORF Transcript_17354/g.20818 Transcript_17354/m.20818 type:complete len:1018 (+) Transcript_17354:409-3462(+)|eukprot:CAMPEP_0197844974 /NCGR_PEP_ID=MMETSP1438-20131217/1931_1 /TAXON_ID=1461541 /ORGANISM="Pterosperma sp., Strain CCMP1384" /LENGTH=1017 /DNA_ID=CAMNT_0043456025 /DNA_START=403 /DNA_END=3456 /DNA_ORIENTATION=-
MPHDSEDSFADLCDKFVNERDDPSGSGTVSSSVYSAMKSSLKDFKHALLVSRRELKPLQAEARRLRDEQGALHNLATSSLNTMAANNLRRVGALPEAVEVVRFGGIDDQELLLESATEGALADAFNNLFQVIEPQLTPPVQEWVCTAEAASVPERDLLGMCPGSKQHLTPELMKAARRERCWCDFCSYSAKAQKMGRAVQEAGKRVEDCKSDIHENADGRSEAAMLLRTVRGTGEEEEEAETGWDPVFSRSQWSTVPTSEDNSQSGSGTPGGVEEPGGNDDELMKMMTAQADEEWTRVLTTIGPEDLPLRVCFLDKSASMACDNTTLEMLHMGVQSCMNPVRGSCLTFLLAGPGETEVVFRRSSDGAAQSLSVNLGCSTWVNEPVARALTLLAPVWSRNCSMVEFHNYIATYNEPPLQVLCMTDGLDNRSPSNLSNYTGLVEAVRAILHPESAGAHAGEPVYLPLRGGAGESVATITEELRASNSPQIPLWLCWIACGLGSQRLLDKVATAPPELVFVDAVVVPSFDDTVDVPTTALPAPPLTSRNKENVAAARGPTHLNSTATSRARERASKVLGNGSAKAVQSMSSSTGWGVGHRVKYISDLTDRGRAPEFGTVLKVMKISPKTEEINGEVNLSDSDDSDAETPQIHYTLLPDKSEVEITLHSSHIMGAPSASESLLKKNKNDTNNSKFSSRLGALVNTSYGALSRTATAKQQRLQALRVLDIATTDLGALLRTGPAPAPAPPSTDNNPNGRTSTRSGSDGNQQQSSSCGILSLEEAMRRVNDGSEDVDTTDAAHLEETVREANKGVMIVGKRNGMKKVDSGDVLKEILSTVGQGTGAMVPEDRAIAQTLMSAALELLVCGGSLSHSIKTNLILIDQLGDICGVLEGAAKRRIVVKEDQLDAWQTNLARPLANLLDLLLKAGHLQSAMCSGNSVHILQACEESLPVVMAVWRFFDPTLTGNKMCAEDPLRRAVSRFQRTQKAFSLLGREKRPSQTRQVQSSRTSGLWKLDASNAS